MFYLSTQHRAPIRSAIHFNSTDKICTYILCQRVVAPYFHFSAAISSVNWAIRWILHKTAGFRILYHFCGNIVINRKIHKLLSIIRRWRSSTANEQYRVYASFLYSLCSHLAIIVDVVVRILLCAITINVLGLHANYSSKSFPFIQPNRIFV